MSERIRGLKCIAAELGVSERTVRRYKDRGARRALPIRLRIRRDHLGWYIDRDKLEQWKQENDLSADQIEAMIEGRAA
jgi:predicted transcriptional regulator